MPNTATPDTARGRSRFVIAVVLLSGLTTLGAGLWAFFWPRSFATEIATFPPYNEHLIHDVGAFQIGIGAAVLATLMWHDAMLVGLGGYVAAGTMHTISHVNDHHLGGREIDPYAIGAVTVLAAGAMVVRARSVREPSSGADTGAGETSVRS